MYIKNFYSIFFSKHSESWKQNLTELQWFHWNARYWHTYCSSADFVFAPAKILKNNKYVFNKIQKFVYKNFFQITGNHVNRILFRCNGFTKMQDIVTLIAYSPVSTVNVKYTVNLIQNFVKPNIKSFYFFKTSWII